MPGDKFAKVEMLPAREAYLAARAKAGTAEARPRQVQQLVLPGGHVEPLKLQPAPAFAHASGQRPEALAQVVISSGKREPGPAQRRPGHGFTGSRKVTEQVVFVVVRVRAVVKIRQPAQSAGIRPHFVVST